MEKIKFTIITPTILRPTLKQACDSLDCQAYKNWEHIIIVDGEKGSEEPVLDWGQRKIYYMGENTNDYGHTPRVKAWDYATGDYILYLDDDDYYTGETLQTIAEQLGENRPVWGVFSAYRKGEVFFNLPPKAGMMTSIQHFHRRYDDDGNEVKWISGGYGKDGEWLDMMVQKYPNYFVVESDPLVRIDDIGYGK